MRRALAGPALALALLAKPARGDDAEGLKLSGEGEFIATYINLGGSSGVIQGPEEEDGIIQPSEASNLWTVGGAGALDAALGTWHLQTEFGGEGTVHNRDRDDTYKGSFGGGGHVGWRDPELGSLGIFGSMGQFGINDRTGPDHGRRSFAWAVGAEGQYFWDPVTLYLQAGYIDREAASEGGDNRAIRDAGFGRVVGRFFATDDCELQLEGSYAQGKMDPDNDKVYIGGWGAQAEVRWPGTPVSGFLKYTGAYFFQTDDSDKLWENRIGFGIRVYFGQPSLKANDRHGTSLDLPRYLQWDGVTAGPLE